MKNLIVIILIFLSCSCARTVYVPIENTRTEYVAKLERDSVYLRDSVFVRQMNDTVFIDRYQYLYKTQMRVDTVLRIDSIQVPYEVVRTVSEMKKGFFFQIGLGAFILAISFITFKIYKYFKIF